MNQEKRDANQRFTRQLLEKEGVWKKLILYALLIAALIYYFPQLLQAFVFILGILFPFIIGALIAFVLSTFYGMLGKGAKRFLHWKMSSKQELILKVLTVLILLVIVLVFAVVIVPEMLKSFQTLINQLPAFIDHFELWLTSLADKYPFLGDWLTDNESTIQSIPSIIENVANFLFNGGIGETLSGIVGTLSSTFSSVFSAFLAIMFALIAFFNSDHILAEFKLISMGFLPERHYEKLAYVARKSRSVFTSYISGTLLDGVVLGTLVVVMNFILGIPYALLTGMICGFFALIPLFGGFISEFLCTLLICIVDPVKGLLFFVCFIVLQQIDDNLIYPNIVGKSTGLPSIYVLMAVTLGAGLAGFVGMLVAIPIATVIYDLLGEQAVARLRHKNYPKEKKVAVLKALDIDQQEALQMTEGAKKIDEKLN